MSKEFVWTLGVDGTDRVWKVLVTDEECVIFEEKEEVKRIKIGNHEKNTLQIDTEVEVFGKECPFQLENEIPYIRINDKWTASDTTMADRQKKMMETQKLTAKVQALLGVGVCIAALVKYLVTKELGSWWFLVILGSVIGITGLLQFYALKKEAEEAK